MCSFRNGRPTVLGLWDVHFGELTLAKTLDAAER